jgi:hypothetical protein
MDAFTSELYALSNCVKSCNLTPSDADPTNCIIDETSKFSSIQYCNRDLYGTNVASPELTNDFLPYMNSSNRQIKMDSLPKYNRNGRTTINVSKNGVTARYDIYPNMYFDLTTQYKYITNLTTTLNTLLLEYIKTNPNNQSELQRKYSDMIKRRLDMDLKLEELFGKSANSINSQIGQYYDSTIYTSILWTVLVTSLLFYTFKKL